MPSAPARPASTAPAKAAGSTPSACRERSFCTASHSSRRSSARTRKPSCPSHRCKWMACGPWSSATPGSRRWACPNVGTGTASSSGSPRHLVPDAALTSQSKIRDVLNRLGDKGRKALLKHGYDVGEGFVDVLSQYQTLQHAAETERLRDLDGLLAFVNSNQ